MLKRSGRNLVPTEIGLAVYRQAEEIFSIGREILDTVKRRPTQRPVRLVVGLDNVVPKEIAYRLIQPALRMEVPIRLVVQKRIWTGWWQSWRCTRSTSCCRTHRSRRA